MAFEKGHELDEVTITIIQISVSNRVFNLLVVNNRHFRKERLDHLPMDDPIINNG